MKINPKYKFVKMHDKHLEIHDSSDGTNFMVAKKHIHPATQLHIATKMQKLDEGGPVGKSGATQEEMSNWLQGIKNFGSATHDDLMGGPNAHAIFRDPKFDNQQPAPAQQTPPPQTPDQSSDQTSEQPPAPQSTTPPQSMDQMMANTPFGKAFAMKEAGIQGEADTSFEGYKQLAEAQKNYQQQMRDFEMGSQQESWNKKVELDNMMQEMQGERIDPNKFWHDKSTGSKIGAALSIVLGGIGAGLTKGPNQAMAMIDKMMDRDLDAQKANLANKHSLYSLNLNRYNNQQMADQSSRLQMATGLQHQISQIAAQTNSAAAQFVAKQMKGDIELQKAGMLNQWGVQAAKNKILGVATGEGGVPITQEHPVLLNDKDYMAKRVVIGDRSYQASSDKEGEELRTSAAMLQPIERDIQKLRSIGPMALVPNSAENQLAKGIMGRLSMTVNEFNGYKRFTDIDAHTINQQFNNPAALKSLFQGDESSIDALRAMRGKMESEYRNKLVNYTGGKAQTFQPMGQQKLPLNKAK